MPKKEMVRSEGIKPSPRRYERHALLSELTAQNEIRTQCVPPAAECV